MDRPVSEIGRILLLGEYGVLNGGERSFLAVCERLIKKGFQFVAGVPSGSDFEAQLKKLGVENLGFSTQDESQNRYSQDELRTQIKRLVEIARPAVVHANSLSMSRLCGPVVRESNVRGVGYLRDIIKVSKKAIDDINGMDCIVAVSQATASWHADQGVERSKLQVIYNGVNDSEFCPASSDCGDATLRAELGLDLDDQVLLYVGQIGMRKGIKALADVFCRVANENQAANLLIVGERHSVKEEAVEYERDIKQQIEAAGLARQVHWLGRRSDVAELMRVADVLLHPARQEPLGRVLLEASASGLPIVTTDVGGSAEIVPGLSSGGRLFCPDDISGIADRVKELLEDPQLRKQLGQKQREIAQSRFSIEQCATELGQVYGELGFVLKSPFAPRK